MRSFDYKKLLPHLLIVAGFAVFALIYCYPALQGKVLVQGDVMSWQAMYQESKTYYDSTGINPLWTNSMFGGMPNYTIGIPESKNLVGYVQIFITSIITKPAYFIFIAMLGFYILMSVMRVDRWLGVIGSIAYAFSYNMVLIAAGHETKVLAIGYLPAVFAGLILIYRGRWLSGAALMGLTLALMIGTNHYQVFYYTVILFAFYVIGKLIITIREKGDLKQFFFSSIIALVVALIGLGPSMGPFLTTKEYVKTTMRGGESELTLNKDTNKKAGGLDKDYAFTWSNGVGETLCLMIPYLYGGSMSEPLDKAPETEAMIGAQTDSLPLYWGPQNLGISGPVYFGAVICFLFVLGFIVIRSPHKWWVIAVCALTIMMSWGDNFKALNYFLFDNLPMYNKFRSPTMVLLVPQLLFPMLGIWGLMEIITGKIQGEDLWKKIKIAAGITAGICVLLAFGGGMFFDYSNPQIDSQIPQQIMSALKEDRADLSMKSALTSAVYILIGAALLWAFAKNKINKKILIVGLGLIVTIDLLSVASNYLNENNYQEETDYESVFTPRPVDQEILKDKDPYYRVLDVTKNMYNDAIPSYFHKNIGGYSPAKMEIYQDLIDMQLGGAKTGGKLNAEVLNMLNTKYIIFQGPQQQPVYQLNTDANGNAWFVEEMKIVSSADEEMQSLNADALGDTTIIQNAFDSKKIAVVRKDFEKEVAGYQIGKDSATSIKLTKYGLNDLSFVSNNSKNGLAVFADIWYPYGWEAYVDGKQTPIIRANYVLRAIKVPAGQHKIEFHFRPSSFETGNTIALFSSILIIGLVLAGIYILVKGKENKQVTKDII